MRLKETLEKHEALVALLVATPVAVMLVLGWGLVLIKYSGPIAERPHLARASTHGLSYTRMRLEVAQQCSR